MNLARPHPEPIGDEIEPLDEAGSLGRDLPEDGLHVGGAGGLDEPLLVAGPTATTPGTAASSSTRSATGSGRLVMV